MIDREERLAAIQAAWVECPDDWIEADLLGAAQDIRFLWERIIVLEARCTVLERERKESLRFP